MNSIRRWIFVIVMVWPPGSEAADVSRLKEMIERTVPQARGTVGVALKHVESGTEVLLNADMRFPMASTYKLPILVEIFYQQQEGKLHLDEMISLDHNDLHLGSGVLSKFFDPPGVSLSIRNLINLMMVISDNSATDILLEKVGASRVTARMQSIGLKSIRVDRTTQELIMDLAGVDYERYGSLPLAQVQAILAKAEQAGQLRTEVQAPKDHASPRDLNRLLERIYQGKIVRPEVSDEILNVLKRCQTGANRIRGLLPPNTVVAHKTGTIGGTFNNTGIVYLPFDAGVLLISVMMKDAMAPATEAERVIAEISRYAFDFFVFAGNR